MNDAARYDALLDAGREPAWPCPVCTGDHDAEPCSEECAAIVARAKRDREIQGLRWMIRSNVKMALRYRQECPAPDHRVQKCLQMTARYRAIIHHLTRAA